MSPEPSELTFHKIQQQHQRLADLLNQIETLLEQRSGPIDEVVRLLGQLGDQLIKHFRKRKRPVVTSRRRLRMRRNWLSGPTRRCSSTEDDAQLQEAWRRR